jgi:hypothetical protein
LGGELDAPPGDAIEHRLHRGVIGGCEEREFDPVACGQCSHSFEEEAKLLERVVRHGLDLGDHGSGVRLLPVGERGQDERLPGGEVPVEAALRGAEPLGERYHRYGGESSFGDRFERRLNPVLAAQPSPRLHVHLTIP